MPGGKRVSLYAWAHATTADEAVELAARLPGLGLVLNAGNYEAAPYLEVPPILYVARVPHAKTVARLGSASQRALAVIVGDERNAPGPAGDYVPPARYRQLHDDISAELPPTIPTATMGLQAIGGPLREIFRARRFDHAYHASLPASGLRAFNPNGVRLAEVRRVLELYRGNRWILSPAPFRTWWERLWEPVSVRQWADLARDSERVLAVAMWCLREYDDSGQHGLLTRDGRLTNVGRQVVDELAAGR